MSAEELDIKALKRVIWRTAIARRIERFAATIEDQTLFEKYFGEKYVERLSLKIDRINRKVLLLALAYSILMVSLFVSQDAKKAEFEIFGYGFKNIGYHKEILLLLAAAISPVSATLSAYHRYLIAIRNECLKKLVPDIGAREFYSQVHVDSYFDPLLKDRGQNSPHGFAVLLAVIFGFVVLLLLLALVAGSFLLQVNVVYDVATNPASSKFVNLFVIAFSLAAIALSWLIGLLQLPLPEIDLSNHAKLNSLKQTDHAKYEETARRVWAESVKKERLWSAVLSVMFFVTAYSAISITWYPGTLQHLEAFIARALPGAVLTTLVTSVVVDGLKRWVYRWFFKRYPNESDRRLVIFSRIGKLVATTRVVTPIAVSVAYAIMVLRSQ